MDIPFENSIMINLLSTIQCENIDYLTLIAIDLVSKL